MNKMSCLFLASTAGLVYVDVCLSPEIVRSNDVFTITQATADVGVGTVASSSHGELPDCVLCVLCGFSSTLDRSPSRNSGEDTLFLSVPGCFPSAFGVRGCRRPIGVEGCIVEAEDMPYIRTLLRLCSGRGTRGRGTRIHRHQQPSSSYSSSHVCSRRGLETSTLRGLATSLEDRNCRTQHCHSQPL